MYRLGLHKTQRNKQTNSWN